MVEYAYSFLKTARPRQWIKNLSLFAALVFDGLFFSRPHFIVVLKAFVIFCLLSSSVYFLNDVVDVEEDKSHPFKKKRPIASGKLPIPIALFAAFAGIITAFFLAVNLNYFFFLVCVVYVALQIVYTTVLKRLPIYDVMVIATGFVLRVYGGALVINSHLSVWFLLSVISFSLFLAVGKRRCELTLLKGQLSPRSRATLVHYSDNLLDVYISMFANTSWLTYALFTFLLPPVQVPHTMVSVFTKLPRTLITQKWLMITIPVVIFGIMRYLALIYEKNEGESPSRVLLADKTLLVTVAIWAALVILILDFFSPV